MNQKPFIGFFTAIVFGGGLFFSSSSNAVIFHAYSIITNKDSVSLKWKTYTNSKYGFTFKYPQTWLQQSKEYDSINLAGTITVVSVNFADTISKTTFTVEYHLPPNGAMLYDYALSQFNSSQGNYSANSKKIKISEITVIEASNIWKVDGKGNPLSSLSRSIIVDFLDSTQKGTFELQFNAPLDNEDIEVAKLEQLLYTFKFVKH